jgi:hypothetical protein
MKHHLLPVSTVVLAASLLSLGCAESSRPAGSPPLPSDPAAPRGRLPPEDIRRVVNSNIGFRQCYDDGLRRNPHLEGRVMVRFVIGLNGSVSQVRSVAEASNTPDAAVVQCVVAGFAKLRFPSLSNGTVTVNYPIMFGLGHERPKVPVTTGPFNTCTASQERHDDKTSASISCGTNLLLFDEMPGAWTDAAISNELDDFARGFDGGEERARGPMTYGEARGRAVVVEKPGKVWAKDVIVQVGPARIREVSCGARAPAGSPAFCEQAIATLVAAHTLSDVLPPP